MVAAVTSGSKWPDGTPAGPPRNVVVVNAEDDPATTVIPRLIAAGADLTRVHFLEGVWETQKDKPRAKRLFDLTRIPELIRLMQDVGDVALVIVDPIMHYIGAEKRTVIKTPKVSACSGIRSRSGQADKGRYHHGDARQQSWRPW